MNERIRCPHWLRLQIGWLTSVEKCRANGAHGLRQTEAVAAAEADAATEAAAEAAKAAASALSSHCFCNNDLAHSRRSEHTEPEGGWSARKRESGEKRRGASRAQQLNGPLKAFPSIIHIKNCFANSDSDSENKPLTRTASSQWQHFLLF